MSQSIWLILIAILIGVAVAWWIWGRGSAPKVDDRASKTPLKAVEPPPVAVTPPVAAAPLMAAPDLVSTPAAKAKAPAKKVAAKPKAKAAAAKKTAAPAPKKAAAPATKKPATAKAAVPAAKKPTTPKAAPAKAVTAKAAPKPAAKATPKPKAATTKAAVAKPKAAAPKAATPKAAPAAVKSASVPDNIELLKGIGPKLVVQLKSLGVSSLDQIAAWTSADIAEIDSKLGVFAGRIGRDNWVDQAKLLRANDVAGFEKKYGALGSEL